MLVNSKLVLSASIVIGCLILGLTLGHTAAGQSGIAAMPGGRYQILVTSPGAGHDTIYVFEPNTGECWLRGASSEWVKLGSPAMSAKK